MHLSALQCASLLGCWRGDSDVPACLKEGEDVIMDVQVNRYCSESSKLGGKSIAGKGFCALQFESMLSRISP